MDDGSHAERESGALGILAQVAISVRTISSMTNCYRDNEWAYALAYSRLTV